MYILYIEKEEEEERKNGDEGANNHTEVRNCTD